MFWIEVRNKTKLGVLKCIKLKKVSLSAYEEMHPLRTEYEEKATNYNIICLKTMLGSSENILDLFWKKKVF